MVNLSLLTDLRNSLNHHGGAVLEWWRDELASLVPGRFQQILQVSPTRAVLQFEGADYTLHHELAPNASTSSPGQLLFAGSLDDLQAFLENDRGRLTRWTPIVLRVPLSACLVRQIVVPTAARRKLRQVLAINLEQVTPFRRHDVFSAHITPVPDATVQSMRVTHLVYKRAAAGPLLTMLQYNKVALSWVEIAADRHGFSDAQLVAPDEPGARIPPRLRMLRGTTVALAVACMTAVVATTGIAIWTTEQNVARVEAEVTDLRKQATRLRQQVSTKQKAEADAISLRMRKVRAPLFVGVLEELSRVVPDTAFIGDMQFGPGEIIIDGWAQSAADLVGQLASSKSFVEASFVAPVTRDPARNAERFRIRIKLPNADALAISSSAQ
jgi:general secretion pathway protein L